MIFWAFLMRHREESASHPSPSPRGSAPSCQRGGPPVDGTGDLLSQVFMCQIMMEFIKWRLNPNSFWWGIRIFKSRCPICTGTMRPRAHLVHEDGSGSKIDDLEITSGAFRWFSGTVYGALEWSMMLQDNSWEFQKSSKNHDFLNISHVSSGGECFAPLSLAKRECPKLNRYYFW